MVVVLSIVYMAHMVVLEAHKVGDMVVDMG